MEINALDQIDGRNRRLCKIYSFLDVTAVRYDEKPDKEGQRCSIRDIVTRRNVLFLTVRLNQAARGTVYCTIDVPEIYQTSSLESQYSVYSETLSVFKTYLRSDVQKNAVTM